MSLKVSLYYCLFAVIATAVNLVTQEITYNLYEFRFKLFISILVGTFFGLVIKYILDKRYIFNYRTKNKQEDTKLFALYSIMGIATTAIFWSFEFAFDIYFQDKSMRYTGAVLGLSIGYVTKYYLDKKYVFNK